MYTVVIVEDDPLITELNRRYTEQDGRFAVACTFALPRRALEWLRHNSADLVILDFYMPQMNGLEFLQAVRAAGIAADVIMITAANDAATVEALTRLGVVDYLVKPFAYERFRQALDASAAAAAPCAAAWTRARWTACSMQRPPPRPPCPKACRPRPGNASWPVCAALPTVPAPVRRSPRPPGFRW